MSEKDAQQSLQEVEIAQRRRRVAALLLERKRQTEIAAALGVSKATVCGDVKAIRQEWREEDAADIGDLVSQELVVLADDENRMRVMLETPEAHKSLRAYCLIMHEIGLIQDRRAKWLKFDERKAQASASELDQILAEMGLGR